MDTGTGGATKDVTTAVDTGQRKPRKSRAHDVDRHVGARIRERRMMLGLTQQQLADLVGVTYQQAHKYEKGINRVAAGRLYVIAQVLGVDLGYFFEGVEKEQTFRPTPQQRLLLDLARNFVTMQNRKHQEAICNLARSLAADAESADEVTGAA
jgi:transcriptional regulator with XRE-family HTH domain